MNTHSGSGHAGLRAPQGRWTGVDRRGDLLRPPAALPPADRWRSSSDSRDCDSSSPRAGAPGSLGHRPQLDGYYDQIRTAGRIGELKYDAADVPARRPSEFFSENCWVGMSFPSPGEAADAERAGCRPDHVGQRLSPRRIHVTPTPREGLRRAFAGVDRSDLELMLAGNAARVYDFDLAALDGFAAEWGAHCRRAR